MRNVSTRPPWLHNLDAVVASEQWLQALYNVDEEALRLLLIRHNIDDAKLLSERVENVGRALAEQRLKTEDLAAWRAEITEAFELVGGINDFTDKGAVLDVYRSEHDPSLPESTLNKVAAYLRAKIWRGELQREAWINFLDTQRALRPRHIFLYRLPTPVAATAVTWTHRERPLKPALAQAMVDDSGVLQMRWIALRTDERRAAYVRVDLESGAMELQLERMDSGGMKGLREERTRYLTALTEYFGVMPELVHLETPMRGLMNDPRLRLDVWRVRLPNKTEAGVKHDDSALFGRLRSGLDRFYALELRGEWHGDGLPVEVYLDARTDAITIPQQCPVASAQSLSTAIRELHAAAPVPEIVTFADLTSETHAAAATAEAELAAPPAAPTAEQIAEIAELRDAVEKLIAYQQRIGASDMSLEMLPSNAPHDLLFDHDRLRTALQKIGVNYLGAMLYVMCPVTAAPVRQGGREILFERTGDIPATIECENEEGNPRTHITEGNIWLRVISPPAPATPHPVNEPQPVDVTSPVVPPEPDEWSKVQKVWIWYVAGLLVITLFFGLLFHFLPELKWFWIVCFVITVIAPVGLIRLALGPAAFDAVTKFLSKFEKAGP
jgi:hypothetical protein